MADEKSPVRISPLLFAASCSEMEIIMANNSKEMDMLNGNLSGKLILFALPLAFSSILQQLFNSADVAVVGRFANSNALPAVGSCVAIVGIFVTLIVGLSVGPNAALANLITDPKDKYPDRKLTPKDALANIDDGIGALALAKIPMLDKLNISGILPLIYTACGYRAGKSN